MTEPLDIKKFAFSGWSRWTERGNDADCKKAGVYVLGRYNDDPPTVTDPLCREVIYIGETVNNSLAGRWYQFSRSAFLRKNGHSAGWTFSTTFLSDATGSPPSWLYVAALPVELDEPYKSAFIRLVERQLLWDYVGRHGCYPVCNRK